MIIRTHRFTGISAYCLLALAGLMLSGMARAEVTETLQLDVGSQLVLREDGVGRVAVGDPEIADVSVLDRRQIMISARHPGQTTLSVWKNRSQAPKTYRVVVADVNAPALMTHPERVRTQVQTDIKVAEVSRKTLKQFSANLSRVFNGGRVVLDSFNAFVPLDNAFDLVYDGSKTDGLIRLLEGRDLVRILAEPSLVAMSGQTASFLAGGEFPIPVQQSNSGGNSTVTIEFKEFGVRLNLTPTVLDNERIVLRVAPEVSELDFTAAVTSGGVQVPALTVRRTETTVELGNGESFLISGLVSQNTIGNVDKVPWLGDIPILGSFFRSTRFNREEKELVMLVTPHLVDPMRRDADIPVLPGAEYDDYDPGNAKLFLDERGDFDPQDTGFSMGMGN